MLAGYALHYNNLEFGPFFEAGHGSYSFAAPYGGDRETIPSGGVGLYANLEAADKVLPDSLPERRPYQHGFRSVLIRQQI